MPVRVQFRSDQTIDNITNTKVLQHSQVVINKCNLSFVVHHKINIIIHYMLFRFIRSIQSFKIGLCPLHILI